MSNTNEITFRRLDISVAVEVKRMASDAVLARLPRLPEARLESALDWCKQHDKANELERFIFVTTDTNADGTSETTDLAPEIQRKLGSRYFTWLCRFREAVEHELALRTVAIIVENPIPTPITTPTYLVSFDRYQSVIRLGRSGRFMTEDLPAMSRDALIHLNRWADAIDRQVDDQHLVFYGPDAKPVGDDVQRLYGWRFFTFLTRLCTAAQEAVILSIINE